MTGRGWEVKDLGGALPIQGHLEQLAEGRGKAAVGADADGERLGDGGAGGVVQTVGEDGEAGTLVGDGAGGLVG